MSNSTSMYKSYKQSLNIYRSVVYCIMIILTLLAIVPIWIMIVNATRSTEEINMGISLLPSNNIAVNWAALAGRGFSVGRGFFNSAFIAICVTVLSVYFSAMTAYGIQVYHFKGRTAIWIAILIIIMLPPALSLIGFYQFMVQLRLTNNYIPLIIPSIAAAGAVLFLRQYMQAVISISLIEAARIDGANELYTFNKIMLPVLSPALAAQAIFSFVGSWNNFFVPLVLLSSQELFTLPLLVMQLQGDIYRTEVGGIYLGIAVSIVPIVIFYIFMSRFIISGLTLGGVKE